MWIEPCKIYKIIMKIIMIIILKMIMSQQHPTVMKTGVRTTKTIIIIIITVMVEEVGVDTKKML